MAKGSRRPSNADHVVLPPIRKKTPPSMAGAIPGLGPFEREEEDPYRVPDRRDQ